MLLIPLIPPKVIVPLPLDPNELLG